jgi:predicted RNA-binding Zn-ribbon protein involved in translation (DUF1610 family)
VNTVKAFCPNCGIIERTVAQQIGGKITFGLAGLALGSKALKDPGVAAFCTVVGLFVGHAIDQQVSKTCPQCGAVLRIAGLLP